MVVVDRNLILALDSCILKSHQDPCTMKYRIWVSFLEQMDFDVHIHSLYYFYIKLKLLQKSSKQLW